MQRVVYGLSSPHMGGVSKWNILDDRELNEALPEVFAPPPEIVAGYMAEEAENALKEWNPLIGGIIAERGLFGTAPRAIREGLDYHPRRALGLRARAWGFLRRNVFDHFGRR